MPLCYANDRKLLLLRNLDTILPLRSKLSGKFHHFSEIFKC